MAVETFDPYLFSSVTKLRDELDSAKAKLKQLEYQRQVLDDALRPCRVVVYDVARASRGLEGQVYRDLLQQIDCALLGESKGWDGKARPTAAVGEAPADTQP